MSRIVLLPNESRDVGLACAKELQKMLTERGHEVVITPVYGDVPGIEGMPLDKAVQGADLLVTLGGDGTILHLAPRVMSYRVPLVGVNLGHKGFLTELDRGTMGKLADAAEGKYEVVPRLMLDVEILRGGRRIFADTAINEALISGIVQNVRLTALGDGERILNFSSVASERSIIVSESIPRPRTSSVS